MNPVDKYISLIKQFISGEITAPQFERSYLQLFKKETEILPEYLYTALNNLFISVDLYCSEENLRDNDDIGDHELLQKAKETLTQISITKTDCTYIS
jgi:hypothetical protein